MTQDQPSRLDRIEVTQAVHSQILNELAIAHRELAEFSTRQAQRQQQQLDRHDEVLSRLENSVSRHDETLTRIEEQTRQNSEQINRLEMRMNQLAELVTTSTTETIQLVAQNSREIREIWRYLRYEPRNGNGRSEE
ncbi:hypothetical protein ACE1AT_24125 [Pelatocladus sp. BLCC-F211]|uniref:hypothetical protein n=1 Tax=Pelatocladus sp. BLCC-F211 TaxID=3342752 RepID=UPI0035B6EB56